MVDIALEVDTSAWRGTGAGMGAGGNPGGDLDDHGSALRAAMSAVWNGTGERSLDPKGLCHLEPRRTS